jgi:competence ComEA-like helix-hairpin-helix protein
MFHTILTHAPTLVNRAAATFLVLALAVTALPAAAASGVVNVNSADESQLSLLPRIGPSIAGRIVELREENGPFESTEDLMLVRGIGEKTFELLEPYVVTKGETTLTEKVRPSDAEAPRSEPEGRRR